MKDEIEINIDEDKEEKDWLRLLPQQAPKPQTLEDALTVLTKEEPK